MNIKPFEAYESVVRSYCRKYPKVFTKSQGSVIFDEDGAEYVDFLAGCGALNYGHNNSRLKAKLIDYIANDGISHAMDMYTVPKRDFIENFENNILKPRGLDYKIMFTGPTGTNAVEAVLKLARKVKKRSNVFALMGGFHGMTLGALALTTDMDSRKGAGTPLHDVTHIPAPYMFDGLDTVKYMERLFTDDHSGVELPAAIVVETLQAEGGIYEMGDQWLRDVRALCDKYDIVMIVDDIQVGVGRTGSFFSFESSGIVPDMVTLSKSIGGFGLPMAVALFKPEYDIWTPAEHNGTFRGNQLAFVAASEALNIFNDEHIAQGVIDKGEIVKNYIEKEILPLDSRLSYRGKGLIWGIDLSALPDGKFCAKLIAECFSRGLIVEAAGRSNAVIKIMPPLNIPDDLLYKGLGIMKDGLSELLKTI